MRFDDFSYVVIKAKFDPKQDMWFDAPNTGVFLTVSSKGFSYDLFECETFEASAEFFAIIGGGLVRHFGNVCAKKCKGSVASSGLKVPDYMLLLLKDEVPDWLRKEICDVVLSNLSSGCSFMRDVKLNR